MSTQSNVCACAVCGGSECKCGCQNPTARPAASCQCGEVCNCGRRATARAARRERAPVGEPVMHAGPGVLMATRHIGHIGWIVTVCLVGGPVVAVALVLWSSRGRAGTRDYRYGPAHVLQRAGRCWRYCRSCGPRSRSDGRRRLPASWRLPARLFSSFAPSGIGPRCARLGRGRRSSLALLAGTVICVHRDLHSRTRAWVVYPLLAVVRA